MRQSHLFGRTLRDAPADAQLASHKLLVRAGFAPTFWIMAGSYVVAGLVLLGVPGGPRRAAENT